MKKHSRVLCKLSSEDINKVKLASEASQENFAFLTLKNEEMAKLEHLICPKVGGHKPTWAPPLLKVRGHKPPLPPPSPTPL